MCCVLVVVIYGFRILVWIWIGVFGIVVWCSLCWGLWVNRVAVWLEVVIYGILVLFMGFLSCRMLVFVCD